MKLRMIVMKNSNEYEKRLRIVTIVRRSYSMPTISDDNFNFRKKLLEGLKKNLV